jgi:hypothetical protein
MENDAFELHALASGAYNHGFPEVAASIFRKLLRQHPKSPWALDAIFYLQNAYQLPPASDRPSTQAARGSPSDESGT